ncbi:hypothetical protein O3P69_018616 [Scylla paramamosain]|uniref:Hexosyltransferase n=1 Tax=Scylla paramamosain TaxID=85552 RepID=A0AAW0T2J5_SCYPA
MSRILNPCVCFKWPMIRWRYILMTIVMMCVMMLMVVMVSVSRLPTTTRVKRTIENYKPYIPSRPNQIRIGVPPNVPRHFLIEEADACTRRGDDLEVVVYVHSAIKRVEQRRLTRLTWANSSALNMAVVFMVGRAKNTQEKNIVRRESDLYHDIVQGDYGDHYHLLTYKSLSALYWINKHCAHVPWTLHADDDLLIDTHVLQNFHRGVRQQHRQEQPALQTAEDAARGQEGPLESYAKGVSCQTIPALLPGHPMAAANQGSVQATESVCQGEVAVGGRRVRHRPAAQAQRHEDLRHPQ